MRYVGVLSIKLQKCVDRPRSWPYIYFCYDF